VVLLDAVAILRHVPFMAREVLHETHLHPSIRDKVANHHREIIEEVRAAVQSNPLVVVGMKQNPHVKRARRVLEAKGVGFQYLEYGSYVSEWRRRNALKMWTGWPTFPMVFHRGVLVGGADETEALLRSGEIS
jgi:glutaredoxin-related protein